MLRIVGVCALVLALCVGVDVPTVEACSGAAPYESWGIDAILAYMPVIAFGTIGTLSDSGYNAVLHVEYYARGIDSDTILYQRNALDLIALATQGRPHPARCGYFGERLQTAGRRFVAGLYGGNGVYTGAVMLADDDGLFPFGMFDERGQQQHISYMTMLMRVAEGTNRGTRRPIVGMTPRPTTVELMTSTGSRYVLPARGTQLSAGQWVPPYTCRSARVRCSSLVQASNGYDRALFYPQHSGADRGLYASDLLRYYLTFEALTGVFSDNAEVIAIWHHNRRRLSAHTTAESRLFFRELHTEGLLLSSITLPADDTLIPGAGAWSADLRWFAFSTESGVWLWNGLQADSVPRLLLATDGEPILVRHFSPSGHYLALESGIRRWHIDLDTLRAYPDGLFSPDDRQLAVFDTRADGLRPVDVYVMQPRFRSAIGRIRFEPQRMTAFEWVSERRYIMAECGAYWLGEAGLPDLPSPWCAIYSGLMIDDPGPRRSPYFIEGTAFDYDPVTRSLGVVVDGDTININSQVIELAGQFDGAIVGITLTPVIDLDHRRMG